MKAHRVTGAYYAKAYDQFYALSERLGKNVANATVVFQWTLVALLVAVVMMTAGALWPRAGSDTKKSMVDGTQAAPSDFPVTAPEPPAAPAEPAPLASPTDDSLLTTPTAGQEMLKGNPSGKELLK